MEPKNIKVFIILATRFPTEKAYGITTRETLESLLKLGVNARIYSLNSIYTDKDYNKILSSVEPLYQGIIFRIFLQLSKLGKSKIFNNFWNIAIILSLLGSLFRIKFQKPTIIWVRDPKFALMVKLAMPRVKLVLEIHDFNAKNIYKVLVKFKKNLFFAPINKPTFLFIREVDNSANILLSPLGIRTERLANIQSIDNFCKSLIDVSLQARVLNIGYVGKFAPGGYSKGVEDLIFLAKIIDENGLNSKVSLVGATQEEELTYIKLKNDLNISSKHLEILPHMEHSGALDLMANFDVLVLPEPRSHLYVGMPIKLLEYLSTGRIVLVAKCPLFISLFDNSFKPFFYDSGQAISLFEQIGLATTDDNLNSKIKLGVEFASKFSWDNRTLNILNYVATN
jgi:hypothetical protein